MPVPARYCCRVDEKRNMGQTKNFGEGSKSKPGFPKQPNWFEDARGFKNLETGLKKIGFSEEETNKIRPILNSIAYLMLIFPIYFKIILPTYKFIKFKKYDEMTADIMKRYEDGHITKEEAEVLWAEANKINPLT